MIDIKNYNNYVGPKAIFDPHFIPPKLLYREKEEKSLLTIIKDSIYDEFSLNILYQGIQGIGKKVIVNKVLQDFAQKNRDLIKIHKVCIDCKDKNLEDLIFSLLTELNSFLNIELNVNSIINSKISHLWNMIKLACKKVDYNLFFIFYNTEYLDLHIYKKLLQFGKETNITLISTINKILRSSTLDLLTDFDIKKKLNFFSYSELYSILKQRVSLTFPYKIDLELIKYVADLICENFVPVPGKGIEILREIYPLLIDKNNIKNCEIMEICQNNFDTIQGYDEFAVLNYITEENLLTILFLDNLSNYFLKKMKYYISLGELRELYEVSCEFIEYDKTLKEFNELIRRLINFGILGRSKRKNLKIKTQSIKNTIKYDFFFMILNPKHLKAIVDTIFNK